MAHALGSISRLALSTIALVGVTRSQALGQQLAPGRGFYVVPPSPVALGQQVKLGIRPVPAGTSYRFVAALKVTGAGRQAVSVGCATPQTIGSGNHVTWTPASGSYRVTVHRLTRPGARDSNSVSYEVTAPSAGWLNVSVVQTPNPSPPGTLTLQLSTNDRGAGHAYQWIARLQGVPGPMPMTDWSGASSAPTISAALIMAPGTYNVTARVGVHRNNPCQIIETSSGTLTGQQIR